MPYPPNYGGVIDVFYKIKALSDAGVKVHLHTFHYGRDRSEVLDAICDQVSYYPRRKFYQAVYSSVPYIVGSRKSGDLLSDISADDHPILFEGLHTCVYLDHPSLKDRKKIVRMHNIEWDYYSGLGKQERNFFRRVYFMQESRKLKQFEDILEHADLILGISPNDTIYLDKKFGKVNYLPAFHPNDEVLSKTGKGDYAIYHGNLSVQENNQAAMYLVLKIFDDIDIPLKVAGKDPLTTLKKVAEKSGKFELIANPYDEKMDTMISDAQFNVLPTFQATGIKLKLLNALYNGRYCVVNSIMVQNTGLEELCIVSNTAEEMKEHIRDIKDKDFPQSEIERRRKLLAEKFSNAANAQELIKLIYSPLA